VTEVSRPLAAGDLLTIAQALAILPVGRSTLYALLESGQLPHFRVRAPTCPRGRILVARADLEAFLAGARQVAPRAPVRPDPDTVLANVRARGRTGPRPSRKPT
jgi:excisionase family DNA binding protein